MTPGRARCPTPLADELVVADGWVIPAAELTERFSRSSGPGGQGVNTTDSRVELSVDVTRPDAVPDRLRARVVDRLAARLVDGVLTVTASEHRAQLDNRRAARDRLADVLRRAAAPPPRAPPAPTRPHSRLPGAAPGREEAAWADPERFSRSSGPGGQGVNTTDSRVELSVDLNRRTPYRTGCGPGCSTGWRHGSSTGCSR